MPQKHLVPIDGKACGSFGDFGILSFNGNKIITTSGEGNTLKQFECLKKARFLATQAKDNAPHYEHSEMGYNYRMSNIAAAIGVGQLKVLERIAARRENHQFYNDLLKIFMEFNFYRTCRLFQQSLAKLHCNR